MPLRMLSIMVALALAVAEASASVTLVRDGRAACTIVTGEDDEHAKAFTTLHSDLTRLRPADALREAAEDLAWHLNEMGRLWDSRHRVRVVHDAGEAGAGGRILLGSAAIEAYDLEAEAAELPYPAYTYRTIGNDLLIFGASSKGAANGIYGFLQDELGVRWFGPQKIFQVVPRRDVIEVGALDTTVRPSFLGRLVHAGGEDVTTWVRRRMRMGERIDEGEPFRNTSHNHWRIFPPSRYAGEHPEYFAMRSGRRQRPDDGEKHFSICYSSTGAVEVATRAALAYFRAGPRHHTFSLGINDALAYCECPECVKLQPPRTFRGKRVASDMYYHFVNEVARRVAEEIPDRYLGTIAYNDVTVPPLGDVEKNVHVVLVNDVSSYFDTDYRARDEELVEAWQKKGITLGLYYYTQLAKLVPACFPRLLAEELKDKHARGFTSVTSEMGNGWPWHGPMAYVEMRLLWDVDLSVEGLLDEYFGGLFGPAAGPMSELYALFEAIHRRPRGGGFLSEHYSLQQFRPYTGEDLVDMRRLLAEAHGAIEELGVTSAEPGLEGRRVAYVSNGLKVFLDMLEGLSTVKRLEAYAALKTIDDIAAMEMLEMTERLNTLVGRHEQLYRETIINDTSLPGRFRRDTCTPVRTQWKSALATAVANALVRLYHQGNPNGAPDERVKARLHTELGRYTADPYRRVMFRFKAGELTPGENRVVNPGFETVGKLSEFPEHLDWTASAATGWAYWQYTPGMGSFDVSDRTRRTGKRSGAMRGIGNGCFITALPGVKRGEMYHVEAHILNTAHVTREQKPSVRMEMRWLDTNDRWTQRSVHFSQQSAQLDEWIKLEFIARVPENVATAVILLTATPLENDEEEIFVDDVSFRRLS